MVPNSHGNSKDEKNDEFLAGIPGPNCCIPEHWRYLEHILPLLNLLLRWLVLEFLVLKDMWRNSLQCTNEGMINCWSAAQVTTRKKLTNLYSFCLFNKRILKLRPPGFSGGVSVGVSWSFEGTNGHKCWKIVGLLTPLLISCQFFETNNGDSPEINQSQVVELFFDLMTYLCYNSIKTSTVYILEYTHSTLQLHEKQVYQTYYIDKYI